MLQFHNRFEFGTTGAGGAPAPWSAPRGRAARSWGSDAADRRGFPDAISDAPLPPADRVRSSPEAAAADPVPAAWGSLAPDYDPLDLEFIPEEFRDHVRRAAHSGPAPLRAPTLEQVVRSLRERGYDPLDLEFMSEEELRDLHARRAAGAEERPHGDYWAFGNGG